jgi:hypothetical protein
MPSLTYATIATFLTAVGVFALVARRACLRGTTLVAPWWWSMFAVLSLGLTECALAWAPSSAAWTSHARFMAAAATLCPMMAVLGARRPQDRAWQLIVASMVLVVVWPAAQALLFRPERALTLHPAWRGFVTILWLLGLVNGLPTRHAIATLLAAAGQACLLSGASPVLIGGQMLSGWLGEWPGDSARVLLGLALCTMAVGLWAWRLCPDRSLYSAVDRAWLDFRDLYGAVWSLRIAERFNAAAALQGWPGRLGWRGMHGPVEPDPNEGTVHRPSAASRQALVGLLRRFVSDGWIAQRWPPS